jgi:hypothetical protein
MLGFINSYNAHAHPSFVDKANFCHCVSPSINSPELLQKHAHIVVLFKPTKMLHRHCILTILYEVFFPTDLCLKLGHHEHHDFGAYEQQTTHFNGQT